MCPDNEISKLVEKPGCEFMYAVLYLVSVRYFLVELVQTYWQCLLFVACTAEKHHHPLQRHHPLAWRSLCFYYYLVALVEE